MAPRAEVLEAKRPFATGEGADLASEGGRIREFPFKNNDVTLLRPRNTLSNTRKCLNSISFIHISIYVTEI